MNSPTPLPQRPFTLFIACFLALLPITFAFFTQPDVAMARQVIECTAINPEEEGCCDCEFVQGPPPHIIMCYEGAFFGTYYCSIYQGFCPSEIECMSF